MKSRGTSDPNDPQQARRNPGRAAQAPPAADRPATAGRSKTAKPTPAQSAGEVIGLSDSEFRSRVAQKAFELYQSRGGHPGGEMDDWLEAERLVREEMGGNGNRERS